MRDLGQRGLEVVTGFVNGECTVADGRRRLKESIDEARSVLADAGYPAESVWRGLQRAYAEFSASSNPHDHETWGELGDDLRQAIESLDALLARPAARDADFRVVG